MRKVALTFIFLSIFLITALFAQEVLADTQIIKLKGSIDASGCFWCEILDANDLHLGWTPCCLCPYPDYYWGSDYQLLNDRNYTTWLYDCARTVYSGPGTYVWGPCGTTFIFDKPEADGTINWIKFHVISYVPYQGSLQISAVGNSWGCTGYYLGMSYIAFSGDCVSGQYSGPWTWDQISSLGLYIQAGTGGYASEAWLEVDYTPAPQTPLNPGETTFDVPINIIPLCDPGDDFTGECQNLALYGDLSYLNVKWNAYYSDNADKPIGIDCYLNCPNPDADINTNCVDYKNSTNYCSYQGPTGKGFCTIVKPSYLYNKTNNVTCNFYDPSVPEGKYLPYPNRTFKPIDFDVYSSLGGSVTVGETFVLPVNVRNHGLFVNNFTINVSVLVKSNLVYIENQVNQTDTLRYNKIGRIYPKVTFLSAEKVNFKVLTKPNTDPNTCSKSSDCTYLGASVECVNSRCWKMNTVEITADISSLPEFNWTGLLQIIVLSAVVILFLKRKY